MTRRRSRRKRDQSERGTDAGAKGGVPRRNGGIARRERILAEISGLHSDARRERHPGTWIGSSAAEYGEA